MNKNFLIDLNQKIAMPDECVNLILTTYDKITEAEFTPLHDAFFNNEKVLDKITALAKSKGIEPLLLALTFAQMCSETTLDIYKSGVKKLDLTEEIFYETMTDMTIWAKVCLRDNGAWGLKEFDWVSLQLKADLYRLGRMQYHFIKFDGDQYIKGDRIVNKGDTVVNIHIPEGHEFTLDIRKDSYKRAYELMKNDVFVCNSWLLYPAHREFLPKESNILSFMDDFEIIDNHESDDLGNMWRVFNRRASYIPSELPRNSGLQRAYADWIEKTGKNGSGYGIFIYK
jgi:hypothetical protein